MDEKDATEGFAPLTPQVVSPVLASQREITGRQLRCALGTLTDDALDAPLDLVRARLARSDAPAVLAALFAVRAVLRARVRGRGGALRADR